MTKSETIMREPHVELSHIPDLFVEVLLLWFNESFGLGSSLFGTGRGPGVDIVVIAGAGIISVDMVNIFVDRHKF